MPQAFAQWQKCVPALKQNKHEALLEQITQLRKQGHIVFPPKHLVFSSLSYCSPQEISVIILGQDPYHQEGQANGLAFSVNENTKTPPSLRNILQEIKNDVYSNQVLLEYQSVDLSRLAKQGVLLLNTILTVEQAKPLSHAQMGWQSITMEILQYMANLNKALVVMLWGKPAQAYASLFNSPLHLVLQAAHPSPLSAYRGFFGCKHFSKANDWLLSHNKKPIQW